MRNPECCARVRKLVRRRTLPRRGDLPGSYGSAAWTLLLAFVAMAYLGPAHAVEVSGTLAQDDTWDRTDEPYVINNFSGPLIVPAGIALTIQSGVSVRSKYSNKGTLSIQGTVEATGAGFSLTTSDSTAGGKQPIVLSESGAATFSQCVFSTTDSAATANLESRVITATGTSTLTIEGSSFTTGTARAQPTYCAVWVGDSAVFNTAAVGEIKTTFSGFPLGVFSSSTAAASVAGARFANGGKGIECRNSGALTVTACDFADNTTGIRFDSAADLSIADTSLTRHDGAVAVVRAAAVHITSTTVEQNTSGVLCLAGTEVQVTGSTLAANGVGLDVVGCSGAVTLTDCQVTDHLAVAGFGVRVLQAANVAVNGGAYERNRTALQLGGDVIRDVYPDYPGWSDSRTFSSGVYGMLGGYGTFGSGAGVQKTIPDLPAGDYDVTFTYYHIDSWEGESGRFFWNGTQKWTRGHASSGVDVCGGTYADSVGLNYVPTTVTVTHPGGDATLRFDSTLNQAATDESWGVDAISIRPRPPSATDVTVTGAALAENGTALSVTTTGDLTLGTTTFAANDQALRIDQADAVSLTSVAITGPAAGESAGGVYTDQIASFAATGSSIAGQELGLRLRHYLRGTDLSGIVFGGNTEDVLYDGIYVLPTVTEAVSLPVGRYVLDNSAGPIAIIDSGTLTLQPGTEILNRTAGRNLFSVLGTLNATGVSFDLTTDSRATSNAGTVGFDFTGAGSGTFTDCDFLARDITSPAGSRVMKLTGDAGVSLIGCSFVSTGERGAVTCYGVTVQDWAGLETGTSATRRTSFSGFTYGVHCTTNNDLILDDADFTENQTGLHFSSDANLLLTGCTFSANTWGLALPVIGVLAADSTVMSDNVHALAPSWDSLWQDFSGISFSGNVFDSYLEGGAALAGNVTLPVMQYDLDLSAGPIVVPAGVTLTLLPGTSFTNSRATSSSQENDLLEVRGTLVATGVDFTLHTRHDANSGRGTYGLSFLDAGIGSFADCTFAASDVSGQANSRILQLADSATVTLTDCSLATAAADGFRTNYGAVLAGSASLAVSGSGAREGTSSFSGFPVAVHTSQLGNVTVGDTTFSGNDHGIFYAGTFSLADDWATPAAQMTFENPLTVPAGVTLTIPAGAVLQNYSDRSLLAVGAGGDVVATGAAFHLVTHDGLVTPYGQGTRGLVFEDDATGAFTDCDFTASERYTSGTRSRVFGIADEASVQFRGCVFTCTTTLGHRTAHGIVLSDAAAIDMGASASRDSCFTGFPTAISTYTPVLKIEDTQFTDNDGGVVPTGSVTLTEDSVLPAVDMAFASNVKIFVPEGVTLTIAPGAVVRNSRPGNNYGTQLFEVRGRLAAADVTFEIETYYYYSHSRCGIYFLGSGEGEFTECLFRSQESQPANDGYARVIDIADTASVSLAGCRFERLDPAQQTPLYGVLVHGSGSLAVTPGTDPSVPTSFDGMRTGVCYRSDQPLSLSDVSITDCDTGIDCASCGDVTVTGLSVQDSTNGIQGTSIGTLTLRDVAIDQCTTGIDFSTVTTFEVQATAIARCGTAMRLGGVSIDPSLIVLSDNTRALDVAGEVTVLSDLTLPDSDMTFPSGSRIIVPDGVTLTIAPGAVIRNCTSSQDYGQKVFEVSGRLVAAGVTFEIRTYYYSNYGSETYRGLQFLGWGEGEFTDCVFRARELYPAKDNYARVIDIADTASVSLAGCRFERLDPAQQTPLYGVLVHGSGSLAVTSGTDPSVPTSFDGLRTGVCYRSDQPLSLSDVSITDCDTGIDCASCGDVTIEDMSFNSGGTGILVSTVTGLTVSGLTVRQSTKGVQGTSIGTLTLQDVVIDECTTGIDFTTVTTFGVQTTAISRCGTAMRLGGMSIDPSLIVLSDNTRTWDVAGEVTVLSDHTLPDTDMTFPSGSRFIVPAGVMLTIPPGAVIRNCTSSQDFGQEVFEVSGRLVAADVTFEIKTQGASWYYRRGICFLGSGEGEFTDCVFRARETYPASDWSARVIDIADTASVSLAGCRFERLDPAEKAPYYGVCVAGTSSLTVTGGTGRGDPTSFDGMRTAIYYRSDQPLSLSDVSFADCDTGIDCASSGNVTVKDMSFSSGGTGILASNVPALTVAGLSVQESTTGIQGTSIGTLTLRDVVTDECTTGIDFTTVTTFDVQATTISRCGTAMRLGGVTMDPAGIDLSDNTRTWDVAGEVTVLSDLTLPDSDMTFPSGSRIIVPAGVTLTIASGAVIRNCTPSQDFGQKVFDVSGRLFAANVTFEIRTYYGTSYYSRGICFLGSGEGEFTDCVFRARETYPASDWSARVIDIADTASVSLAGCRFERLDPAEKAPYYGVYVAGTSSLTVTGGTGREEPTSFDGMRTAIWCGDGTQFTPRGVRFTGNDTDIFLSGDVSFPGDSTMPNGVVFGNGYAAITVPKGASLTVPSGCLVSSSHNNEYLRIYGSLTAEGAFFEGTGTQSSTTCRAISLYSAESVSLRDCMFTKLPVAIYASAVPETVDISENMFLGNSTYAVQNASTYDLDCRNNWWGHTSGPRHRGNPLGVGNAVSDHVLYRPFQGTTDIPVIELSDHPAGQAANVFLGTSDLPDSILARFSLAVADQICRGLTFRLVNVDGIDSVKLSNVRLVLDVDGDGQYGEDTDTLVTAGVVDLAGGTIGCTADTAAAGQFLLVADLEKLASGDAMSVHLHPADVSVDPGVVAGGAMGPAIHSLGRLYLSDHQAGQRGDRLGAAATQEDVRLLGCHLTAGYALAALSFDLSDISGISSANVRAPELVLDTNGNGIPEPGETVLGNGATSISGSSGTIVFHFVAGSRSVLTTGVNMILRADLTGLDRGDTLTVRLTDSGVTPTDPGIGVRGATLAVRHEVDTPVTVMDTVVQQSNHFAAVGGAQADVHLLGFTFIPAGRRIAGLRVDLLDVYGIEAADVGNVRIVRDPDRDGVADPGETQTVGGSPTLSLDTQTGTGTISFGEPFTAQSDYILLADFADLETGDALTVTLTPDGVAVPVMDAVEGGVSPVRHVVESPDLTPSSKQQNWTLTYRSPGGLTVCGSYSHDGTKAILGYSSGAAYIYDASSNTPLLMLYRHYDKVQYAGFSADDETAVTVTRDGAVYLWDVATGTLARNLFSDILVRYAVTSPDCSKLFIVTDGKGMLLDVTTGETLWEFVQGTSQLYAADWSPDASMVLVGAADKRAYLLHAQTGQIVRVFQGHSREVTSATFAAGGTRVLTSSPDATATLWYTTDPVNPICTATLAGHTSLGACVSRDGSRIAMITKSGDTSYLRLFDDSAIQLWAMAFSTAHFTGSLSSLVFDETGERLLVCSNSPSNTTTYSALAVQFRAADSSFVDFFGPRGRIATSIDQRVRVSEDGNRIFFMHGAGLDVMFREPGRTILPHPWLVASDGFSITADGGRFVHLNGSRLDLYAVDEERFTHLTYNATAHSYDPISLSRSGGLLIVGDRIYRAATGEQFCNSPNNDGGYRNTFSPDERFWGIPLYDDMTIKTMETTDDTASLAYAVTLTAPYKPMKILYHPDGRRVGCVDPKKGVQFYILWDESPENLNRPLGLVDYTSDPTAPSIADAVLSPDGSMLLIARGNSVRLYAVPTIARDTDGEIIRHADDVPMLAGGENGRVLRYFYPMHSGQATCTARSVAFGKNGDLIMIAWSDNYVEEFERSQLRDLIITPETRTLAVGESQEFTIEAVYDDGSRADVSPEFQYRYGEGGIMVPGARLTADPATAVSIEENTVTVNPGATGTVVLTAVYAEGERTRTATAAITVGESPLVELVSTPAEVTITHGVVQPIRYTAHFDDGYARDVTAETALTADQPDNVRVVGNNVTVLQSAGACEIEVVGSYTYRGVTQTATTTIISHGPQSTWEREWATAGGDVNAMCFSPDGTRLATGGSSGAISIFRVGLTPSLYRIEKVIPAHARAIQHLFYLSDQELVSIGGDGRVRRWDVSGADGVLTSAFLHDAAITCAAYHGGQVALGDNLGRVTLVDLASSAQRWIRSVHTGEVRAVALDGDSVLSGGRDRTVVLMSRATGDPIRTYPGFAKPVVAVGYMGDMTYALSEDKRLVKWEKGTDDENLWEYFFPSKPTALSYQNDRLYVSTAPNSTWVYDANGFLLQWLEHPPDRGLITCVRVSPDGRYVVTGRSSTIVERVVNRRMMKVVSDFHGCQFWNASRGSYSGSPGHSYSLADAKVTQDGTLLFTQCSKVTQRWSQADGVPSLKFLETGYFVSHGFDGLETTGDEAGLLATRVGGSIYIMDMAQRLLDKSVHTDCTRFALSPDGARLVTNTSGELTRFWDIFVDFPTVLHENPAYSYDVAAAWILPPYSTTDRHDTLGSIPEDQFVSIVNEQGLRFSGITTALTNPRLDVTRFPPEPEDIWVSRNGTRCAVVVRQVKVDLLRGTLYYTYLQVYDISDRLAPAKVFERFLSEAENVKPKLTATLSDDGGLLFYGMEKYINQSGGLAGSAGLDLTSAADEDLFRGHLVDLSTARQLYIFTPPSMDTISNQGVAAAQFTRNDGALMIAWKEGYAEVCERQGLARLDVSPIAQTLQAGEGVDLRTVAVYADGTALDVTEHADLTAEQAGLVTLAGSRVTVNADTPFGTVIRMTSAYQEQGATKTAVAQLTVGTSSFVSLAMDPGKISVATGTTVTFRSFAHFANGTSADVTTDSVLSADPADRVVVTGNTIRVPATAQPGDVRITTRCVREGDERSADAILHIRDPFGTAQPGDLDGDRDVDFNDLVFFVGHYGETVASTTWSAPCDLDGDGDVDFNDVTRFVGLYGTNYTRGEVDAPRSTGRQSLVEVTLAGPAGPVCVGDTFAVEVYVQENSPPAAGFRGGPVDIAFDATLAAMVGEITEGQVIQTPFDAIVTSGTLGDGRIEDLGGVTLADGFGDGQPVLYAVLTFRALCPGTARVAAAAGTSGLALTPPVGQVDVSQIDYGQALDIEIRAGTGVPGPDELAPGALVNFIRLLCDGTPQATVAFGSSDGASDAFSYTDGDRLAEPADNGGVGAWFVLPSGEDLACDVRGTPTDLDTWFLLLRVPGNVRGDCRLEWDLPLELPSGTRARLTPADDSWAPAPPGIGMSDVATSLLPNGVPGLATLRYLLTVQRVEMFNHHLQGGWNLIGMPLDLDGESGSAFRAFLSSRLWAWDPTAGYVASTLLEPTRGYWAYALHECSPEAAGTAPLVNAVVLNEGWNLVSPNVDSPNPESVPGVQRCWRWVPEGATYQTVPRDSRNGNANSCRRGVGYWVYATDDGVVIWDR